MAKYDCYGEDGRAVHLSPCSQALGINGPCCSIDDDGTDANEFDHEHALEAARAVDRGVVWLDEMVKSETVPSEWWNRINLDRLDMVSTHDCILGQLFWDAAFFSDAYSGYDYAYEELFDDQLGEVRYYGFNVSFSKRYGFSDLQEAWTATILELREKRNAQTICD